MRFDFVPEVIVSLGGVFLADYARPGTPDVTRSFSQVLSNHNTFILAKHGSLTLGRDLQQSFNRLENLEHNAKIAMIALSGGQLPSLPAPEVNALEQLNITIESSNHPIHGESSLRISDEEVLIEILHRQCQNGIENDPVK
jgi:L-fuculose-phosphate aldolase